MSRNRGHRYQQWIGVKRLKHRILLDVIRRLFREAGLYHKYYMMDVPGAHTVCQCLTEAWQQTEGRPRQVQSLCFRVTRRTDEAEDMVLVEAVLITENQAVSRLKKYAVCGTPKGYLRTVNGG